MIAVNVNRQRGEIVRNRTARLVRSITIASAALILLGGMFLMLRDGTQATSFHQVIGEPAALRFVPEIVMGAFHREALSIIPLGILILIVGPVARVLFAGDQLHSRA